MVLLLMVNGYKVVIEIVFENCFMYVVEFKCMNVNINVEGCSVKFEGKS